MVIFPHLVLQQLVRILMFFSESDCTKERDKREIKERDKRKIKVAAVAGELREKLKEFGDITWSLWRLFVDRTRVCARARV